MVETMYQKKRFPMKSIFVFLNSRIENPLHLHVL